MKLWNVTSILALGALVPLPRAAGQKPNIVLIVADDLDADEIRVTAQDTSTWPTHTGAEKLGLWTKPHNPNILTPHIDGLTSEGILLTNFHVSATQCTASRYAFLTGRQAARGEDLLNLFPTGSLVELGWNPGLLREETNVAKSLKAEGYRTGIIGKWHNIPRKDRSKLPRFVPADHRAHATYEHTVTVQKKLKTHYDAHVAYLSDGYGWDVIDRMEWGNSILNLNWQCEGALEFIEESADQPFFLYVGLPVPHGQYAHSFNDLTKFDDRVTSKGIITNVAQVLPPVSDVYARTDAAGVRRDYAMATRMDDFVGAILQKLDDLGLRQNTLFIFTSDHASRGKNSCYIGGAKVPFLARWPQKIQPNTKSRSLVASVDVAATLVDVAGGNAPKDMLVDGQSFKQMLLGKPEPENWRNSLILEAETTRAVVTKKWSYIANRVTPEIAQKMAKRPGEVFWSGKDHHNYQTENTYPGYWDADQLYDLEKDLYQQTNIFEDPKYKAILKSLRGELDLYIATLPHSFGEFGKGVYADAAIQPETLKSEGYVQGELKSNACGWTKQFGPHKLEPAAGRFYLRLPKRANDGLQAMLNANLPHADSYQVALKFTFGRKQGLLVPGIIVSQIKETFNDGTGRLGVSLRRAESADKYELWLAVNPSSWMKGPPFVQDLLGFSVTKSSSENLQLVYELESGSNRSDDWVLTGTLRNLDRAIIVSKLTGQLDSSQVFITDENPGCVDPAKYQNSSLLERRCDIRLLKID